MFPIGQPLLLLGTLRLVEAYDAYDGVPLLFSARDENGITYLVVLLDEDEDSQSWLCAPLSTQRFDLVRTGRVELRDVFLGAEGGTVFVVAGSEVTAVSCRDLEDDQLPSPGETLSYSSSWGSCRVPVPPAQALNLY